MEFNNFPPTIESTVGDVLDTSSATVTLGTMLEGECGGKHNVICARCWGVVSHECACTHVTRCTCDRSARVPSKIPLRNLNHSGSYHCQQISDWEGDGGYCA